MDRNLKILKRANLGLKLDHLEDRLSRISDSGHSNRVGTLLYVSLVKKVERLIRDTPLSVEIEKDREGTQGLIIQWDPSDVFDEDEYDPDYHEDFFGMIQEDDLRDLLIEVHRLVERSTRYDVERGDSDITEGVYRISLVLPSPHGPSKDEVMLETSIKLEKLLKRKGLIVDLVAESGQGIGITVDDSLGGAMETLHMRTSGIRWVGNTRFMFNGTYWNVSDREKDQIDIELEY